jgi:hypothetical protein
MAELPLVVQPKDRASPEPAPLQAPAACLVDAANAGAGTAIKAVRNPAAAAELRTVVFAAG